jgi:5'-deoxynucleotidase YfbR-like HD superfamily hydrolase
LSIEEVEKELKKILVSPEQQKQALNNFKLMQMNSTLENRRTKFSIKKEMLLQKGDHTINSWRIK